MEETTTIPALPGPSSSNSTNASHLLRPPLKRKSVKTRICPVPETVYTEKLKIYEDYAKENYHPTVKRRDGSSMIASKVEAAEKDRARWRSQNISNWKFGVKRSGRLGAAKNKMKIVKDELTATVIPVMAFKWWLSLTSKEIPMDQLKAEWKMLSPPGRQSKDINDVVWREDRKGYSVNHRTNVTMRDRGAIVWTSCDTMVSTFVSRFWNQLEKRKTLSQALETSNLVRHNLSEKEAQEKFIVQLDEYGCLPLDSDTDWNWGVWHTPTVEEKMKLTGYELAAGFHNENVSVPIKFNNQKYFVSVKIAFKLWLHYRRVRLENEQHIQEEWSRLRNSRDPETLNVHWGNVGYSRQGYGAKLKAAKKLQSIANVMTFTSMRSPSLTPSRGSRDGTLRLAKLPESVRLADAQPDLATSSTNIVPRSKTKYTALTTLLSNTSSNVDTVELAAAAKKVSSSDIWQQMLSSLVHTKVGYKKQKGNFIGKPIRLHGEKQNKRPACKPVRERDHSPEYHRKKFRVYVLVLLHKSRVEGKSTKEVFRMMVKDGLESNDLVYAGKTTSRGGAQPSDYHKAGEHSSVGKKIKEGGHVAYVGAVLQCENQGEQEKLEAWLIYYLLYMFGTGKFQMVNKLLAPYRLTADEIEQVFTLAEADVPLLNFVDVPTADTADLFQLNFTCRETDFERYRDD